MAFLPQLLFRANVCPARGIPVLLRLVQLYCWRLGSSRQGVGRPDPARFPLVEPVFQYKFCSCVEIAK